MPTLLLTPKEIHILVQMIAHMIESEEAFEYAKTGQLESIRNKLQNVKD